MTNSYDPYYWDSHYLLRDGSWRPWGRRHSIRKCREESGRPIYEVSYYISGYGQDRLREYKSLKAAKAATTRYDNI